MPTISSQQLAPYLQTAYVGRHFCFQEELASTNLTLHEMGNQGAPDGMVLAADHQTSGRGRDGRAWQSPAGCNLYVSVLLRPHCTVQKASQLSIVTAFALHRALEPYIPQVQVKWPNDIWTDGKKLCGILCSMSCLGKQADFAVIGIGLNVNMTDFPPDCPGTSLKLRCGRTLDRTRVLAQMLNALELEIDAWKNMQDLAPWCQRWKAISLLEGKNITVKQRNLETTGIVDGISPEGYLRLIQNDQVKLITVGDAHILHQQCAGTSLH